ncbi:MAG: hypothetical protein JJ902_18345 [Roseibium sp.]|nr:hypothetical protein [Roseibium sp.]
MNAAMNVELACAIAYQKEYLESYGYSLKVGHDFHEFNRLCENIKKDVTEHFSPIFNTLLPISSFWIMLTDPDGRPVGTVASRLEVFTDGATVASYLRSYLPRIYQTADGLPVQLAEKQPSFCEEASGRVVYLGEAHTVESARRNGLGGSLVKLIQLVSLLRFEPDYLYCWIRPRHAESGFPQACGYKEVFPRAIRWIRPPAPKSAVQDLWLAGNRRGGLLDLVGDVLAERDALGCTK